MSLDLAFILCGLCFGFLLLEGGKAESQASFDYCQPGLCPRLKRHIACSKNLGNFGMQCPRNATSLVNLTDYQSLILNEHNSLRNALAAGKSNNELLPLPDRMATLQWHAELEYLATVSVMHCALLNEPCHSTREFRNTGQNMALIHVNSSLPADNRTDEALIKDSIAAWWSPLAKVTAEQVQNFPKAKLRNSLRNFAVMARDNNTFVGCAVVRFVRRRLEPQFLLACNYASNYLVDRPIYRAKAMGCQRGADSKYPALCRRGEPYPDVAPNESSNRQSWG
ncbi:antigen 5 like allergen Cul n 1-like [Drosophila guanche]|nr:antigen 5 like allergen Cul n 1-like [Drosophila guanche]